jgi:uncharacterized membrane protein
MAGMIAGEILNIVVDSTILLVIREKIWGANKMGKSVKRGWQQKVKCASMIFCCFGIIMVYLGLQLIWTRPSSDEILFLLVSLCLRLGDLLIVVVASHLSVSDTIRFNNKWCM